MAASPPDPTAVTSKDNPETTTRGSSQKRSGFQLALISN